jgi:hypothetical protein
MSLEPSTSPKSADDLIVVNASNFSRQRRENLFRMHAFVFDPDPEADEIVLATAVTLNPHSPSNLLISLS